MKKSGNLRVIKKLHIYKNKGQEEYCELENRIQDDKVMYEE